MNPPSDTDMISMYHTMLKIRLFENEILRNETNGLAIHSCAGHEAIAIGVISQLSVKDLVVSNHRPWGHFIAKGGNLKESFAEILGKKSGVCNGIGGEMGISKPEIGFVQSTMIIGACLTLACGVALSIQRLSHSNNIAVVFFGEATSTNGAFNESLIMAKNFKLPLLFVCENNGINGNTPASDYMPSELVIHRASGYGFPTNVCDGSDVLAVYESAQKAIEYVRTNRTPYFLECLVARRNRHKIPRMPDTRIPEIKRIARMRDPLLKLHSALINENILTPDMDASLHNEIVNEVSDALRYAKESD